MSEKTSENLTGETGGQVVVRYWAAARAAAGIERDLLEVDGETTLAEVLEAVRLRHVDQPKFKDIVTVCSILIGDRPVGTTDPGDVVVRPGDSVEMLPPFAGG